MAAPEETLALNRRRFVAYFSTVGLGSTLMPGALAAIAQASSSITSEMVGAAARVAGLEMTSEEVDAVVESLNGRRSFLKAYQAIREANLENSVAPALVFNPLPQGFQLPNLRPRTRLSRIETPAPSSDEDLAFLGVRQLGQLLRNRTVTSLDLTRLYLARLKKYGSKLHCVVTLTEDLALKQARQADQEIAAGDYRGPLHGIPWGAKDLVAVRGYPTTWGATPYKDQVIDQDATVFERLTTAGAVLVAKLSMGALAQGDRWFGGKTLNPWNLKQGSSGSSAGPAAAVAAGLTAFAIGSETQGSIISPASRCGVTGLRPTFGMVSRAGAMTLSWSMDKLGPMGRSAEDCALVLEAIHGPDGKDRGCLDVPFGWDARSDVSRLRVAYLRSGLEGDLPDDDSPRVQAMRKSREQLRKSLDVIRSLGIDPKPVDLPEMPTRAAGFVLVTEAAAAFDQLTRSDRDDLMLAEPESSRWPAGFRLHRFVPAVEYIQANRIRTLLIEKMHEFFSDWDVLIGSSLRLTNLTGHPEIVMPNGFFSNGSPTNFRLTGSLFGDGHIARLAHAFQSATKHHLERPRGFA